MQLVHRVPNAPILRDGHLRWDLSALCAAADEGMRKCANIAVEGIAAIGVTGWAVDYVRLNAVGEPLGDPFCYRDVRAAKVMDVVHQRISSDRLYARTGIQVLAINTLYQLYADNVAGTPADFRWLNLPEYMLYRWGGRPVAEYTNATHTGLVALDDRQWCEEIFSATGLDISAAPEIVPPGSIVGKLHGPLSQLPALLDTVLIAPACHDTASAIAGIPATGDDWAFISSGTWSLVGTLLDAPCAGLPSAQHNFTNEGGAGGTTCFLRNVNGMWLLNQCIGSWNAAGGNWTEETIVAAAAQLPAPELLFDVDDPSLLQLGDMPRRIATLLQSGGHGLSGAISPPQMTSTILHSLAARYAIVLRQAETLTGRRFRRLYIVGGGSRNTFLNQLTEKATGLPIICGSSESSTLGNFAVQLAALQATRSAAALNAKTISLWAELLAHSHETTIPTASSMTFTHSKQLEEDHV